MVPHSHDSNLVDSASSHTLVSKIKPCMSKYKRLCTVKLRMAHYISYSLFDRVALLRWITVVILELIHTTNPDYLGGRDVFIRWKPMQYFGIGIMVIHNN